MRHKWAVIALVILAVALVGNQVIAAQMVSTSGMTATPDSSAGLAGTLMELTADEANGAPGQTGSEPQVLTHVVAGGETLDGIAAKYGTDLATIKSLNSISSGLSLQVGQQLRVMTTKGVLHKIASGDTLWDIARAYQVTVTAIYDANPGLQGSVLKLGKEIIVPGAKPLPARPTTTSRGSARTTTSSSGKSTSSSSSNSSLGLRWPLSGHITSGYGMRWGKLHAGLDIGVKTGTTVRAATGGTVTYAGWAVSYGYLVKIKHSGGYETRYGHNSKVLVKVGQTVAKGQAVSLSGNTGFSTGPHLHFEVRKNGKPVNPLTVLP